MGYPTVESHPWRPRITSIGADLSPVDCDSPCCFLHLSKKTQGSAIYPAELGPLTGLSHRLPPAYCSEWCPPPRRGRAGQFSSTNSTTSELSFTPEADDHGRVLTCRAHNPRIPDSALEDKFKMNVHCKGSGRDVCTELFANCLLDQVTRAAAAAAAARPAGSARPGHSCPTVI
ncbi:unnamed protein product [Plutella xylostella]|uniref:(diamondback moth) hypothetical protein n=1 Tax=Plutella xylostella TaxID=51655 RepID=A0A8S4DW26_PLUXY|nr:unnamed protein product [Plutella xylostella]